MHRTSMGMPRLSGVTRGRGSGPPQVTPSSGVTPKRKKLFVGKFTKNSGETRSDR